MSGNFQKICFLALAITLCVSFTSAEKLTQSVEKDTGFSGSPYESGDTVQGTVDVTWTSDDPDNVLPCSGCTGPTQLKWQIFMTYQDSSGNWYTEQVGETSFGPGDSRKEGDTTDETVNPVTINTNNNVDTNKYNVLTVRPVLSPAGGTSEYIGDNRYLMAQTCNSCGDGGGGGNSNSEPVPKLDIPSQVQQGNSFTADASGSYDSDGSIASYDWDWTDDGTYENFGNLEKADHSYLYPGEKTIRLRVEDDKGATSSITKTIEVKQDCPKQMVGYMEVTDPTGFISYPVKTALWDKDPSGSYEDYYSGCNYNNANPQDYYDWLGGYAPVNASSYEPKQFVCENGTTNQLSGYNYPSDLTTEQENYWQKAEQLAQKKCRTMSNDAFNKTGETAPVAQYYIPISAIPTGEGTANYVSSEGDYRGIITHDFQSLYDAMRRYDGGDNVKGCEECEKESTWLDKNMSATQGYVNPSDSKDEYENAWVLDNMGGEKQRNVAESTGFQADDDKNPQEGDVFPGGYAGNCQGILTWQLSDTGDWECSSNVNPTQEIFLPTFDFPSDDQEMVRVGFHIMPHLFNTSRRSIGTEIPVKSFKQETRESLPESQSLERLNAVCWWGDANRYSELKRENAGQTWFTVVYHNLPENPENPIPVHGELNVSKRADYGGGPSCRWSYTATPAVKFADEGLSQDPYALSGTVTNIASNAQSYVDERNYTSSSIDLQEDYTSPMNSNDFRDVSFEWQNEAGYTRYDSAYGDDGLLSCVPNNNYFTDSTGVTGCTSLNFNFYQIPFI